MEIEKYLNGELSPEEQSAFEEKARHDAALREELEAWRAIRGGLRELRIESAVANAARARKAAARQLWLRRAMLALLIAGIWALVALVWFSNKRQKNPATDAPAPEPPILQESKPLENQPIERSKNTPQEKAPAKKQPIAERPISPREKANEPLVRSAKPDLDAETNRLIDILLKYTIQKEGVPNNRKPLDRPIWGAAVRALLQNQPAEAKPHIFDFEKTDAAEAQWLLGIALLEEGKLDEAEAVFEKISQNTEHPRRELGAWALRSLRN